MKTFRQNDGANKLDILLISDNSSSMETDQRKLGSKFSNFISAISDVDWQIGVTTTDIDDGEHGIKGSLVDLEGTKEYILTPRTPNASKLFLNTVVRKETIGCYYRENPPYCGSTDEQPIRASMMAMDKRMTDNIGFFRDNADLAIVVISDEDEMSTGPKEATKPNQLINHFRAIWGATKELVTYGIVIRPGDKACLKKQRAEQLLGAGGSYATHVTELARLTGGYTISICEDDYGNSLREISKGLRKLLTSFDLGEIPATGSVEVRLTPAANIGYMVEGSKVIFNTPPPAGTLIEIKYSRSGN